MTFLCEAMSQWAHNTSGDWNNPKPLISGYAPGQATLKRNPILDEMLYDELQENRKRKSKFRSFQEDLPVYDAKAKILDHIRRHRVTIISGETGSGKTTQVHLGPFINYVTQRGFVLVLCQGIHAI